jgi:poly(A) polymerase
MVMIQTMEDAGKRVCEVLQSRGFEAVFAGGWVRDKFLNIPSHDVDVATNATPDEVIGLFLRTIEKGKVHGVISVMINHIEIEVSTFRADGESSDGRRPAHVTFCGMEEDAKRRDLTINGAFWDPIKEQLFDFVGAKADIDAKIIRFIGDPTERILEDNLRILRAFRFAGKLGFTFEAKTKEALSQHMRLLSEGGISIERVKQEFDKILEMEKPSEALKLLHKMKAFNWILKSLAPLHKHGQSPTWHSEGSLVEHPVTKEVIPFSLENRDKFRDEGWETVFLGTVWDHTLMVVDEMNKLIALEVDKTHAKAMRWGALMHDVGKPRTVRVSGNWKISNHGHDAVGVDIASAEFNHFKLSNEEKKVALLCIGNHMELKHIGEMRKSKAKELAHHRFIRPMMLVCLADSNGSHCFDSSKEKDGWLQTLEVLQSHPLPDPVLDGNDLFRLSFSKGPVFSEIIRAVRVSQLEGKISSKEDAEKFVLRRWKPQ